MKLTIEKNFSNSHYKYNENKKTLTIYGLFSQPIEEINFPKEIEQLIFADYHLGWFYRSKFNSSVDFLPNTLILLVFGYSFNQPVDNLPNKLTNLIFGKCKNFVKHNIYVIIN